MTKPQLFELLKQIKKQPLPYPIDLYQARRKSFVAQVQKISGPLPSLCERADRQDDRTGFGMTSS